MIRIPDIVKLVDRNTLFPITLEEITSQNRYWLTRGFTVLFSDEGLQLDGGKAAPHKHWPLAMGSSDKALDELKNIWSATGAQLIGYSAHNAAFPARMLFETTWGLMGDHMLSETILSLSQHLRYFSRTLMVGKASTPLDLHMREQVAYFTDMIKGGHLGPNDLQQFIDQAQKAGRPIREVFFENNLRGLVEDVKSALQRASHHYRALAGILNSLNKNLSARDYPGSPASGPCEMAHSSEEGDSASVEFTSTILALYSTLDFLYQAFVYTVRPEFPEPTYPSKLHFPDVQPSIIVNYSGSRIDDLNAASLPFAIPNLSPKHFTALRSLRNDSAHNMSSDDIRPDIYLGVLAHPEPEIQYAEYAIRDIGTDGSPIIHPWWRRFYQQKRNAQAVALSFFSDIWQCTIDSLEWLVNRLRNKCISAGMSIPSDYADSEFFYL